MSEMAHRLPTEPITREPIYELESSDGTRLIAAADSLDGIVNTAKALRDEGEDVDSMVVKRSGRYDSATTALIQEDMV